MRILLLFEILSDRQDKFPSKCSLMVFAVSTNNLTAYLLMNTQNIIARCFRSIYGIVSAKNISTKKNFVSKGSLIN